MDQALGALLVEVVKSPPAYGILLGQEFSTTVESITVVANTMPVDWPLRADFHAHLAEAKELYDQRNGAVHGMWTMPGPADDQIRLYTMKRWGKTAVHPWSPSELGQTQSSA